MNQLENFDTKQMLEYFKDETDLIKLHEDPSTPFPPELIGKIEQMESNLKESLSVERLVRI